MQVRPWLDIDDRHRICEHTEPVSFVDHPIHESVRIEALIEARTSVDGGLHKRSRLVDGRQNGTRDRARAHPRVNRKRGRAHLALDPGPGQRRGFSFLSLTECNFAGGKGT